MNIKNKILKNFGNAIITALIGAGLVGYLGTNLAGYIANSIKEISSHANSEEAANIRDDIFLVLTDPANCNKTLAGKNIGDNFNDIVTSNNIQIFSVSSPSAPITYGNGAYFISSMKTLIRTDAESNQIPYLLVNLHKTNTKNTIKRLKLDLTVQTTQGIIPNTEQIVSCEAKSNATGLTIMDTCESIGGVYNNNRHSTTM